MVTDEERDYMYAEYAKDPRMKANIGIRRRLAPLLENDRNQLELFTALLLSLPGSPVLYYGDEIGMGDNIWLGDRDGVRTPDAVDARTATPGSPRCDPGRLYLPLIMDPLYGYQAVNVEAQLNSTDVAAALDPADDRDPQAAPGVRPGRLPRARRLQPDGAGLRARRYGDDDGTSCCASTTCRGSRSRWSWTCRRGRAACPHELTGGVPFPPIGELPYLLTLPGSRLLLVLHHARGRRKP